MVAVWVVSVMVAPVALLLEARFGLLGAAQSRESATRAAGDP